jgi:hypothetical protein
VRTIFSVLSGCVIAAAMYWTGALATLLLLHGSSLGGEGIQPTRAEVGIHVALAAIGSLLGALAAIKLSGLRSWNPALATALLLSIAAMAGSHPRGQWPEGFGAMMALGCLAGAGSAALWRGRSS